MSSYAYEDCTYILSSFVVVKVDREAIAYGGGDTHHPRSHDGALDRWSFICFHIWVLAIIYYRLFGQVILYN